MQIDISTVERLAHLARLEFDSHQKQQMLADMNRMIAFFEQLNQVDTSHTQPLIYMTDGYNQTRPDAVLPTISKDQALSNAPKKDSDYFRVAKVIEKPKT